MTFNPIVYKAKWHQENKDRVNSIRCSRNKANRDFRKSLLSVFPCIACGESDPILIDWHHVNPDEKLFNISMSHIGHDKWWSEVLKCIPLCCNCHRKIHFDLLCLLPIHL